MNDITPFGFNISKDNQSRISLTDIWRTAGEDPQKSPAKWRESEPVQRFIQTAARFLNVGISDIIKSSRGKGGGTFGHQQVALEYAQYLDPKLAVAINELFLNPEAAATHAVAVWERKGKSKAWIGERMAGVLNRKEFTDTLKIHGVAGSGYKDCTNAIYTPLWGGGAEKVRLKKGLAKKANTRESMSEIELAAVRLAELLARETIDKVNAKGNSQCANICEHSGRAIANGVLAARNNNQKNL